MLIWDGQELFDYWRDENSEMSQCEAKAFCAGPNAPKGAEAAINELLRGQHTCVICKQPAIVSWKNQWWCTACITRKADIAKVVVSKTTKHGGALAYPVGIDFVPKVCISDYNPTVWEGFALIKDGFAVHPGTGQRWPLA